MHHYDRLKNTSLISAWKVRMTSRFEQPRGKLETIVNLQTFYLLIHLKLVNQKLTIMGAIPQIAKEKLKLDKVGIKEYQSTCKLKWLFLHHLQIKTKIIKCILTCDHLRVSFFGFFPPLLHGTQWVVYSL